MNVLCPLSKNSNVSIVEIIKVSDLVKIYEPFQLDISSEFRGVSEISLFYCSESDLYFFDPPVNGSEKFYEHMQKFDWYYLEDKNEYGYASRFIEESDLVLEIGCGRGAFSEKILSKKYVGLEFSRRASELANAKGIKVINESVELHSSQNTEKYDVVCAFQVLEHIANIDSFIASSLSCLKIGGVIIFSVPSYDSFSRYVANFALDMPPHHLTRWTDKALNNLTRFFPIEVIDIIHEPLQLAHKQMYIEALLRKSLSDFLKNEFKNIDSSFRDSAIRFVGKYLTNVFSDGLSDPIFLPRGISVVAIYRKVNN
jgi:2-polyprenyl-3-methyl-5-hydroxy-6-metoxy-1,4-benzoquinol methylase